MDYLHWIGKKYYTMNSFEKEAEEHGVTRRVSLQVARKMSWGDTIYCAMLKGKTGVIFGFFTIDKLTGLSPEALESVTSAYENKQVDEGGATINRDCGEYVLGTTLAVASELPAIIDTLQETVIDDKGVTKLMIGGYFQPRRHIRLLDIPFRQGFRTLDAYALLRSASVNNERVQGQFYMRDDKATSLFSANITGYGWVQAVGNYHKKTKGR